MGYGRQYFGHTVATVLTAVLTGVLFYVLRVVLYRHLAPEHYGLFYSVIAFGALVYPLLSFGFDPGIVPYITRFREESDYTKLKSALFGSLLPQVSLGILLVAVALIGARPIASLCFDHPDAVKLVRIAAVYVALFVLYKASLCLLLGMQLIVARSLVEFCYVAVCLLVSVLLIGRGWGVDGPAWAYVAAAGAGGAVGFVCAAALRHELVRARLRWQRGLVAEIFRTGKYLSIAFGGVVVFSQMDTVMLTLIRGDFTEVAAYQVAVPTATILYGFILAVARNFMPMATTLQHRGETRLLADGIARIYDVAAAVFLPATILAACFADVLMAVLWRRDVHAAPAGFTILACGTVFYFFCYLNLQVLSGIGRTRDAAKLIGSALALNLALNVVLIVPFGVRGAATATVLSHVAATVLGLRWLRRELDVRVDPQASFLSAVVSVVLAAAAFGVRCSAWFLEHPVAVSIAAVVVLYGLALVALELTGAARLRELAGTILARPGPSTAPKFDEIPR